MTQRDDFKVGHIILNGRIIGDVLVSERIDEVKDNPKSVITLKDCCDSDEAEASKTIKH